MSSRSLTRSRFTALCAAAIAGALLLSVVSPIDRASATTSGIATQVTTAHPRLLSDADRFTELRAIVDTDSTGKKIYATILESANGLLSKATLTYQKPDGIRILATSRELVERSYTLGFAWQITGDSKYAERLWNDLDAVTRFPDWNPDHFLDTAEMTHGVAIAYDWLYSYWSSSRRTQLSNAIVDLGLQPAVAVYDAPADSSGPYAHGGNWSQNTNNWNVVVNSGLAVGAIAIAQDNPALSEKILSAALESVRKGVSAYAPGGGYAEGLSYWDYATRYLVVMLQSLQSSIGDDFGLSSLPGVSETGYFPIYMTNPSGTRFNFGDSDAGISRGPALAGLGEIYDNPSFTYAGITEGRGAGSVQRLLWYSPSRASASPTAQQLPLDRNFENAAVASFRSSWSDTNATFAGFRTGSMPDAGHQHLDAGTFTLDALGQYWAAELGKDEYGLAGYFDGGVAGERWNYYRLRAEGQNTLVINPYTANPTTITSTPPARFESNVRSAFAVADLSALYPNDVTSWKRGIMLLDGRQQVLVQDEIRSSKPVEAIWSMHTTATIEISSDGRSATLTLNGKQLLARIVSKSATAKFVDTAASPLPSSPQPQQQASNTDVRKLTIAVSTTGNTTLAVLFTPLSNSAAVTAPAAITALDSWALPAEGTSRASGVRVNGVDIPNFSPSVLYYTARWDPASGVPTVVAYKSGATVKTTLPSQIPGIATTTITEPGKSPTTYRVMIDRGPVVISSAAASRTTAGTPALTHDGDLSTYWSTWQDNSITYTLAEPRSIQSILINWRANSSRHTKFEVLTSSNGSTWTTLYDGAFDGSSGPQLIVPAASASSKYVRIVGHGDEASDPRTSIAEVTLYNYDSTPPTSAPDPARVGSVTLSGISGPMVKEQTASLAFTALSVSGEAVPASSLTSVKYVSGDQSIVSVSNDGIVTAARAGETSVGVIVTTAGGMATAYLTVTVQDPLRVRIYANADSYVRGGSNAGDNYGSDTQLTVKPASGGSTDESFTRVAYMSFDVSQLQGQEVVSAVLSVNAAVTEPTGDTARLDVHAVGQTWTESGLTFTNRPTLGATVASTTLDAVFEYRAADVTDYVSATAGASASSLSLGFTQDIPFLHGDPLIAQLKSRESSTPPYIDVVLKPTPLPIVSSSSTYSAEGTPAATYDNNPATYWSTKNANSIKYTFAQALPVKSATISWRANRSEYTKFELQTSVNGSTWTTQYSGAYYGPSGDQTIVMESPPATKHFRIVGRGDQASDPRTIISEVRFYSSDITEPFPDRLPAHLSSVAVSGLPSSIPLGQTATIAVAATSTTGAAMDQAALSITYSSSDPTVLSVDSSGLVTPIAVGAVSVDVVVASNGASITQTVAVAVTDPTRIRIFANADSYVRGGASAELNFGTDSRLSIKPASGGSTDESYTRVAYMGFDLSSLNGKEIVSAILYVNTAVTESAGDVARLDVHAVDDAWSEAGLTFTNRPALGANVGAVDVDKTFAFKPIDLSQYVSEKVASSGSALSIGFTQDTPFLTGVPLIVQVRSRESVSFAPYLDIVVAE